MNDNYFDDTIFDDTCIFKINKNVENQEFENSFYEVTAVSYTHLDVYKRQLQEGPHYLT